METLVKWIAELNNTNHTGFAFLTVMAMAFLGGSIALVIEILFMAFGIKSKKVEIDD